MSEQERNGDCPAYHEDGVTMRDYYEAKAMQAWIIAISRRHDEPGYSDHSCADEANRLARYTAEGWLAQREK